LNVPECRLSTKSNYVCVALQHVHASQWHDRWNDRCQHLPANRRLSLPQSQQGPPGHLLMDVPYSVPWNLLLLPMEEPPQNEGLGYIHRRREGQLQDSNSGEGIKRQVLSIDAKSFSDVRQSRFALQPSGRPKGEGLVSTDSQCILEIVFQHMIEVLKSCPAIPCTNIRDCCSAEIVQRHSPDTYADSDDADHTSTVARPRKGFQPVSSAIADTCLTRIDHIKCAVKLVEGEGSSSRITCYSVKRHHRLWLDLTAPPQGY
jgi:hypothetical protein